MKKLKWLGDGIINSNIIYICITLYPNYDESELSSLKKEFIENQPFSEASMKYGLTKLLRYQGLPDYFIDSYVAENLMRSLFGALFEIGENVLGKGLGYIICRNVASNMFAKSIKNQINVFEKDSKSFVVQTLDKLTGIQNAVYEYSIRPMGDTIQKSRYSLTIYKKALDILKVKGFDFVEKGIFTRNPDGSGDYKLIIADNMDLAKDSLYSSLAHDMIEKLGINQKMIDEINYEKMLESFLKYHRNDQASKSTLKRIVKRQKDEGYDFLKVDKPGKKGSTKKKVIYPINVEILTGIKYDKDDEGANVSTKVPLLVCKVKNNSSKTTRTAKLLEAYANGKTIDYVID